MVRGVCLIVTVLLATIALPPASAYRRPGSFERVSVRSDGSELKSVGRPSSMTPDARYVAFCSADDDIDSRDLNRSSATQEGWDVFVHDRVKGQTRDRKSVV